jgi:enoyl-CoA hydratase/carnithine racemase
MKIRENGMPAPHVLAEVKDGIGWLTLNRPESLNALSFEMTDLLIKHTAEFERDSKVRCVVIRGAGTPFMAGGDIRGFHQSLSEKLGVAKRLIRTSFDNSWDEHSHREAEGLAACAATEDHFEGLNAFLEKRPAAFKGR